MTAADVQLLLDSCDRSTHVGIRDYAIMMLIARLVLRSIEAPRLELRDVDCWIRRHRPRGMMAAVPAVTGTGAWVQVQGDGIPGDLRRPSCRPVLGEETGGQVGAVEVETLIAVALTAEPGIVRHAV
jgi:hypothetical protein